MKRILCLIIVAAIIAVCYFLFLSKESKQYNLVFISIDTLRADRLSYTGYKFKTSPNIDKFAKKSILFEDAISVSGWTLPAHITMFTGLFPGTHGVNKTDSPVLANSYKTFPEILKEKDYINLGYVGGAFLNPKYGFGRGFDKYFVNRLSGNKGFVANRVGKYDLILNSQKLIEDLETVKDRLFFMFLHTYMMYIAPTHHLKNIEVFLIVKDRRVLIRLAVVAMRS